MAQHVRKSTFIPPTPTFWIERTSSKDGNPPADVLLLLYGYSKTEEASPIIQAGFYSSDINTFLAEDHQALEQENVITHYHVIQLPDGNTFSLY